MNGWERLLLRAIEELPQSVSGDHPSPEDWEAYVADRLAPEACAAFDAHLSSCLACTVEAAETATRLHDVAGLDSLRRVAEPEGLIS